MSSYYIGFDSGTQGTKVAIYADDSRLVAEAFRAHQILYPKPGWAEMDANQFSQSGSRGHLGMRSKRARWTPGR